MIDTQTRMSNRIEVYPLEELLQYSVADELDPAIIETPMVHPVLINELSRTIVRGFARVQMAAEFGIQQVPVIALGKLGPQTRESYLKADDRMTQCAGWTEADLRAEWDRLLEEEGL